METYETKFIQGSIRNLKKKKSVSKLNPLYLNGSMATIIDEKMLRR